jgi:hypothetical protein
VRRPEHPLRLGGAEGRPPLTNVSGPCYPTATARHVRRTTGVLGSGMCRRRRSGGTNQMPSGMVWRRIIIMCTRRDVCGCGTGHVDDGTFRQSLSASRTVGMSLELILVGPLRKLSPDTFRGPNIFGKFFRKLGGLTNFPNTCRRVASSASFPKRGYFHA